MWALWAYDVFQERMSSIIDRSYFSFSRFTYDICAIQWRESKDRAAGTYMSCKSKSRRLFYWREHTAHMFIRTQSYVCLCLFACECVCAQSLWLYAHWLDIEQISWLQNLSTYMLRSRACLVSCWVLVRAPQSISHGCFVWHFICLVFLLCFLPCLGWPRLKTIRYHDLTFSQKTSPLLFLHFLVFIV